MHKTHYGYLLLLAFLSSTSCTVSAGDIPSSNSSIAQVVRTTEAANDPAFHKALLQAASEYKTWGTVEDNFQFAPALCAAPNLPPRQPNISSSRDAATHGKKIYYLYAKDKLAYTRLNRPDDPQTIVKESWTMKKTKFPDGEKITPDQLYALFVMMKMEGSPKGTDNGWVYGTVSADGKTVTSSGKVQSCMGCHQEAQHGRLFGLKK